MARADDLAMKIATQAFPGLTAKISRSELIDRALTALEREYFPKAPWTPPHGPEAERLKREIEELTTTKPAARVNEYGVIDERDPVPEFDHGDPDEGGPRR